jgi:RNase P protein component
MRQLDWERETPKMMAARKNGNQVIEYRTPLFSIRAVQSAIISDGPIYSKFNPLTPDQKDKTPFGIIATIKSVSKSAVERNKVRTRFKEAIRLALTRAPAELGSGQQVANGGTGSMEQVDLPTGEYRRTGMSCDAYSSVFLIQDTTIWRLLVRVSTPNQCHLWYNKPAQQSPPFRIRPAALANPLSAIKSHRCTRSLGHSNIRGSLFLSPKSVVPA